MPKAGPIRAADRARAGAGSVRTKPPGHDLPTATIRFVAELVAWVATPWALWSFSAPAAILAVVLLIGLPAVFSTPGDRPAGNPPVAVPGIVTVLLVLLQLAAATVAAWVIWPWWIATAVTLLCAAAVVTEQPRWRALLRRSR